MCIRDSSSDVANLRFSNIDWEKEIIRLTQVKTGNPLELPLLEDVGEAIINYLKNARPKTDSDHVFVRQVPPYTNFNPVSYTHLDVYKRQGLLKARRRESVKDVQYMNLCRQELRRSTP